MNILVCVKRVPATGGRISLTDDAREHRHAGTSASSSARTRSARSRRRSGIVEAQGGDVRRPDARARPRPPSSSATRWRSASIARSTSRPTAATGIRSRRRRRSSRRSARSRPTAARSTSSCSATSPPTRAASRSGSGSPPRSAGRSSPARRGSRSAAGRRLGATRGARRLGGLRGAAAGGRRGPRGHQPAALPVGAGSAAGEEEGDRARRAPSASPGGPELIRLVLPVEQERTAEILGTGPEAAPRVVEVLRQIGVL